MHKVLPFILCGGAGTRLWPLSREALPKQFHKIAWQETLFQQTCRRVTGDLFGDPIILSNQYHRFLVTEQLRRRESNRLESCWSRSEEHGAGGLYCGLDGLAV